MYFFEIIGIIFSIYLFIIFFKKLNYSIPLLELFILVISINYIVSPFLIYNYFLEYANSDFDLLRIKKEIYFNFVVPCVLSFYLGIYLFKNKKIELVNINKCNKYFIANKNIIIYFIILGLIASVIQFFNSNFVFKIFGSFLYLSIFFVHLYKFKYKNLYTFLIFSFLIYGAFKSTVYYEFFIKFIIFLLFVIKVYKIRLVNIFISLILVFFIAITLGIVKQNYRSGKDNLNNSFNEQISYMGNLLNNTIPLMYEYKNLIFFNFVSRLSLGNNVAVVLDNIPQKTDFLYGTAYIDYLWNVFFLNNFYVINNSIKPNGKKMGVTDIDKFYYEYASQNDLGEVTTINLSYIETAYINFGKIGAILISFLYGFFLKKIYNYYMILSNNYLYVQFFLFYFFMQLLIVETGLQQIFNFTIKSIIIINLFIYITNLNIKKNNYSI